MEGKERRVSAASEIQRRQYFILKKGEERKGREGRGILGYKPADPEDPKTKRKTAKPRVGTKRENRSIVSLSHSAPLFLCSGDDDDEQPTGTIITVRRERRRNRSVSAVGGEGLTEGEGEQGSGGGREGGRRNPPLLAPQRRLFGNFLSRPHYSILTA